MDLTLRQLVNYHVLSNIADRDALNNELGLNPVLASREPSSLLPSKDLLPIKSVEFNLPKPPSIIPKNPAVARAEVEQWRTHCLNQLNPDTDPGRLANKTAAIAAADAIHANGERFTCRNCRVEVRHWWSNGNQWQCPSCELCTFITDQRRPDGTTYGEFAQARIRAVQAQRAKVNADADALIAKLQNPR
jgi:hypothetical protein